MSDKTTYLVPSPLGELEVSAMTIDNRGMRGMVVRTRTMPGNNTTDIPVIVNRIQYRGYISFRERETPVGLAFMWSDSYIRRVGKISEWDKVTDAARSAIRAAFERARDYFLGHHSDAFYAADRQDLEYRIARLTTELGDKQAELADLEAKLANMPTL